MRGDKFILGKSGKTWQVGYAAREIAAKKFSGKEENNKRNKSEEDGKWQR